MPRKAVLKPPSLSVAIRKIKSSSINDRDAARDFEDQLSLANEALEEAIDKIKEQGHEIKSLRDDYAIKTRAVSWAFRCILLVPLICAIILTLSVLSEKFCVQGFCPGIRVSDAAQLALISGPMILLATVLGLVLRGVFPAKSTIDSDNSALLSAIKEALKYKS
jgi:biotin operon repressor